ncbi:MAG: hypothetical protein DBY16_12560 [Coprobacter sp.]|jgi:hypothetical protein|nr:hypothetical protein [Barnesiella sp. GGCC_0306]MBS7039525.1 hypothetical protein [Bacteroidales bacterium]PWM88406.1 MAG: hypothetical protein DBY16_12560 [Coprobacter sp.]
MKASCFVLVSVVALFFISCGNQAENELIYTYSSFNAQVSCIAGSSQNKDSYYAGLENGDIVRVNVRTNENKIVSTGLSCRIYDILEEKDTLWVGTQNCGLVKLVYSSKSDEYDINREYKIVFSVSHEKNIVTKNYSLYNMAMDTLGNLFLGTSSGIYLLQKDEKNGSLISLYRPDNHKTKHFGVNLMKIIGDSIVCVTEEGLVILNKEGKTKKIISDINPEITYLYEKNDTLFASSAFMLYKIYKNFVLDSIPFSNGVLRAYIADTMTKQGNWIFEPDKINYSNNDGCTLPFSVPVKIDGNYKNYLYLGTDFLFFANGTKVYAFSLHQNPKGNSNNVVAVSMVERGNSKECYFITSDNHLYIYENKGSANWLGSIGLSNEENILQVCSSDNCLWLVTDKRGLYKIDLNPGKIKKKFKYICSPYTAKKSSLQEDFKSIFYVKDKDGKKNQLFVGTRYVLYCISDPENKPINRLKNKEDYLILDLKYPDNDLKYFGNDLYVTDVCLDKERVYISTLNYGLFKITDNCILTKEMSPDSTGSIYQMAVSREAGILLKSSKGILSTNKKPVKIESSDKKNIKNIRHIHSNKFLSSEKQYYIGYRGVGYLTVSDSEGIKLSECSYLDIQFNKAAVTNGFEDCEVILGARSGIYKYNGGQLVDIGIQPQQADATIKVIVVFVGLLFLGLIVGILLFYFWKRRISCRIKKINLEGIEEEENKYSAKLGGLKKRLGQLVIIKNILHVKKCLSEFRTLTTDIKNLETEIHKKLIEKLRKNRHQEEEFLQIIQELRESILSALEPYKSIDDEMSVDSEDSVDSLNNLQKLKSLVGKLIEKFRKNRHQEEEFLQIVQELRESILSALEPYKSIDDEMSVDSKDSVDSLNNLQKLMNQVGKLLNELYPKFRDKKSLETVEEKISSIENLSIIKDIFDSGKPADYKAKRMNQEKIKTAVEEAFQKYPEELEFIADLTPSQKIVAGIYLKKGKMSPLEMSDYIEFNNKKISDRRNEIHIHLEKIKKEKGEFDKDSIAFMLYNATNKWKRKNPAKNPSI